jgi:multidrug efflux pump subunit AcrA (membrane-fusion protein)
MQLGSTLLSALEKKDAEELALLRSTQEQAILNLTTQMKEKQIEDAKQSLVSLQASLNGAQYRSSYYQRLSDDGYSGAEIANLTLTAAALVAQTGAIPLKGISVEGYLVPTIFGLADGGLDPGDALMAAGTISESLAGVLNQSASMVATIGQYQRRAEDWDLQKALADYDYTQIKAQIAGATVRQAIAERDLEVQQKTIAQAGEMEDFLKNKFTDKELYQWMMGRISTVYFQTYKLAFNLAQSAERAYQYELNTNDTFISFGYWDSLKKGLLSGEGLMLSLDQLEKAYTDNHARELEIEKTISLLQ